MVAPVRPGPRPGLGGPRGPAGEGANPPHTKRNLPKLAAATAHFVECLYNTHDKQHAARYALPSWARELAAVAGGALLRCVGASYLEALSIPGSGFKRYIAPPVCIISTYLYIFIYRL